MSSMSKAAKEVLNDVDRNKPVEHNMRFKVVMMTPYGRQNFSRATIRTTARRNGNASSSSSAT